MRTIIVTQVVLGSMACDSNITVDVRQPPGANTPATVTRDTSPARTPLVLIPPDTCRSFARYLIDPPGLGPREITSVEPADGEVVPGQRVVIHAAGFPPDLDVMLLVGRLEVDTTPLARGTTDTHGVVSLAFQVPEAWFRVLRAPMDGCLVVEVRPSPLTDLRGPLAVIHLKVD